MKRFLSALAVVLFAWIALREVSAFRFSGLFLTDVGPGKNAEQATTRLQMKQIELALSDYWRICGNYPNTEQGLGAALTPAEDHKPISCGKRYENGTTIKAPSDGWGTPFKYSSDGQHYRIEASHDMVVEGPGIK
jgi:hypothetical protein